MGRSLFILGTSRRSGNTRALVDHLVGPAASPIIDLSSKNISVFDYSHANADDDFLPLIESMLDVPRWHLATPVYWYTMSAQMKIFLDRLNDLITLRKELGRRLRGIEVGVVATGVVPELPDEFEAPFRLTCGYLGMHYLGAVYAQFGDDDRPVGDAMTAARESFGRFP